MRSWKGMGVGGQVMLHLTNHSPVVSDVLSLTSRNLQRDAGHPEPSEAIVCRPESNERIPFGAVICGIICFTLLYIHNTAWS